MSHPLNVQMILTALVARTPLYLEGEPGVGKTATVETVARWLNRPLVTIIGATRDRTDFGGWPRYDEGAGRVRLHPFPWVQQLVEAGSAGILFIDEMNSNEEIFPVLLRVLAERHIGDIPFAGDVLAAGNPEELSVAGLTLPPPVANRVIHYRWQTSARRWADGMRQGFDRLMGNPPPLPPEEVVRARIQEARALVAAYVERNPHALLQVNPNRPHGPWPSPRSWELLARFLGAAWALGMDEEVQALGVQGAVGEEGMNFLVFFRNLDLPPVEEVLADPRRLPTREDAAFVTLMAVARHVAEEPSPERWTRAWRVLGYVARERQADLAGRAAFDLVQLYKSLPGPKKTRLPLPREEIQAFKSLVEELTNMS
jgi:hypothetical protein